MWLYRNLNVLSYKILACYKEYIKGNNRVNELAHKYNMYRHLVKCSV